jgi:hypothetical protein
MYLIQTRFLKKLSLLYVGSCNDYNTINVRIKIPTAVLMKIHVYWDRSTFISGLSGRQKASWTASPLLTAVRNVGKYLAAGIV